MTTVVGILILIVCLWLAFKVVGVLIKIALWAVVIGGIYWLLAPYFGWPWPPF
ncbi:hypothetical protein LVB87_13920 [Lysobacter sp. KIS68-7]|uniref:hypothetical protein n=1 Tax=Lysobacter sp. KIS68-7 TaxID=2904252 RepID=UPI001E5E2F08|nr:hypothetical protein [Lysobacter sp. KIS68-7]UHQ19265.1 hypothetical protein LVB87_13920 [Lysobacter sp. KIS68-7]